MDAIPFKKPSAKALLNALPEADRAAFISDLLAAALAFEQDKEAVGYASMILYRDGKRSLFWNTVRGSGFALERAFTRSGQEIIRHLREKVD